MPFVSIRIVTGHGRATKDRIAGRIADAIADEAKIPREAIWITFEEVAAEEWYVAERSVAAIRKGAT